MQAFNGGSSMRRPGLHLAALLAVLLLVPAMTQAEDAPAESKPAAPASKDAEASESAALVAQRVEVPGTVTAVQAGSGPGDLLIGTDKGTVHLWTAGKGIVRSVQVAETAIQDLAFDSKGTHIAAGSAEHLMLLKPDGKQALWQVERPVTFGFAKATDGLLVIQADATVARLDLATGKQTDELQAGAKRKVVKASISPDGALAVLGVADG